jgi:hypothetical protein
VPCLGVTMGMCAVEVFRLLVEEVDALLELGVAAWGTQAEQYAEKSIFNAPPFSKSLVRRRRPQTEQ